MKGQYVRISVNLYEDARVLAAGDRAAFMYVESICRFTGTATLFSLEDLARACDYRDHSVWGTQGILHDPACFTDEVLEAADALCRQGLWQQECDLGYSVVPASDLWLPPRDYSRAWIPDELRRAVYERDGNRCLHCGSAEALSLDHIHPWSRGGKDTFDNLQTLCRPCNSRKGARV